MNVYVIKTNNYWDVMHMEVTGDLGAVLKNTHGTLNKYTCNEDGLGSGQSNSCENYVPAWLVDP
jgi:hypothetical protein